jgi:nucleoside-diphosphate-sugar epimerase
MRVLLTGAGGFIGSHLLRRFLRDGDHAVAVVLRPGRTRTRIDGLLDSVEVIPGDLVNAETLAEPVHRFAPEIVVHAAWAVPTAKNRNSVEHAEHVHYTISLLKLAHAAGASHFVGIGSQAEYGAAADRHQTQAAGQPSTLYGTAKLCAGMLAERVCATVGMRFAWLRLFSAYGPGEDPTWLIPAMCAKFMAREKPATTAGEQRYDYLYIDDVAEAVHRVAIQAPATGFFDLGSGRGVAVREVIERVRDLISSALPALPIGFGEVPYAADQVMRMEANIDRLQEITGWRPQIDLETGLRRAVDWFRRVHEQAIATKEKPNDRN